MENLWQGLRAFAADAVEGITQRGVQWHRVEDDGARSDITAERLAYYERELAEYDLLLGAPR